MDGFRYFPVRSWLASFVLIARLLLLALILRRFGPRHVAQAPLNLQPVSLAGHRRLLVLAPHCFEHPIENCLYGLEL